MYTGNMPQCAGCLNAFFSCSYLLLYIDSPMSPGLDNCSRTGVSPLLWGEEEQTRPFSGWWKAILGLASTLLSS